MNRANYMVSIYKKQKTHSLFSWDWLSSQIDKMVIELQSWVDQALNCNSDDRRLGDEEPM